MESENEEEPMSHTNGIQANSGVNKFLAAIGLRKNDQGAGSIGTIALTAPKAESIYPGLSIERSKPAASASKSADGWPPVNISPEVKARVENSMANYDQKFAQSQAKGMKAMNYAFSTPDSLT